MEKAFYPRCDTANATVSNLLPRDGKEDILPDWSGDPVYLQRSSVLDGTDVRGFGYVNGHPYKWRAEIESAVKSIAIVPDRFFSTYGKVYPIKRKQTVGINQSSEAFKYEIIYMRGYDKYDDEPPKARIIYHKQAEENITHEYTCNDDKEALAMLDNFNTYPYLKLRVCYDGSIKTFLGKREVDWELERPIEDTSAAPDTAWVETNLINTEQFRGLDLWLRFDSMNALAYYIITKYENDIYSIGPKVIHSNLEYYSYYYTEITATSIEKGNNRLVGLIQNSNEQPSYSFTLWEQEGTADPVPTTYTSVADVPDAVKDVGGLKISVYIPEGYFKLSPGVSGESEAYFELLKAIQSGEMLQIYSSGGNTSAYTAYYINANDFINSGLNFLRISSGTPSSGLDAKVDLNVTATGKSVDYVVGCDYDLDDPSWVEDSTGCTPCCKKANLSRSIWAYVNPKTMEPYDDDYWFHQGEPYYKKSLTLSTKDAPLKAQRIFVEAGTFPGMYKIVGETYIRSRDTGEDQRVQLSFPLCQIRSNQTLTLQADGDPTTFNLDVEVATPPNGIPMEITFYEVEKDMKKGCCGNMVEKDGSTKIAAK